MYGRQLQMGSADLDKVSVADHSTDVPCLVYSIYD